MNINYLSRSLNVVIFTTALIMVAFSPLLDSNGINGFESPSQNENYSNKSYDAALPLESKNAEQTEQSSKQIVPNILQDIKCMDENGIVNQSVGELVDDEKSDHSNLNGVEYTDIETEIIGSDLKNDFDVTDENEGDLTSTTSGTTIKTIQLSSDNSELSGKALGHVRKSGSYYASYSSYYVYISGPSNNEYHGWAAFDLKDLTKWEGVKIRSARLLILNNYMYYFKCLKFNQLKTEPADLIPSEVAKILYTESGSNGINIGKYTLSAAQDASSKIITVNLNSVAISSMNSKLKDPGSSDFYTYAIGMYIPSVQSGYSIGYASWYDIRLELTFDYTKDLLKTPPGDGVAFGSDILGYVSKTTSASKKPGYAYTSKGSYENRRSYGQWDLNKIKKVMLGENQTKVYIIRVLLRFNHYDSTMGNLYVYQMIHNVSKAGAQKVYTDCGNGTCYFGPYSASSTYGLEYQWDLGIKAVKDLQNALDSKTTSHFAIGMITNSVSTNSKDFGFKLVIEWADKLTVYNKNQDRWYPHIQSGIDDANPGDSIIVYNETYTEHVLVNKKLNITTESSNNTFIKNPGYAESVRIIANEVEFNGFTFIGGTLRTAIKLKDVSFCRLVNNVFKPHSSAITVDNSNNITIENNIMYNCGILIRGDLISHWNNHNINNNTINSKPVQYMKDQVSGSIQKNLGQLIMANCSNSNIKNMNIKNSTAPITLGFSNNITISSSSFENNNKYGVYLKKSYGNSIVNCVFNKNIDHGVALYNSSRNLISYNYGFNNDGNAIYSVSSELNQIQNNVCFGNINGIYLESSVNTTVKENSCTDNKNSGIESIVIPGITEKKIPIDVVLVLDSSGSMSGKRMLDLQTAAKNFINHEFLDSGDRAAIYDFGGGATPMQTFTKCSPSGKQLIVSKIKNLSAYGGTPLWDKIGYAVNYVSGNGSSRYPIVIALTDGGDTTSKVFSPWHDWGTGNVKYQNIDGTSGHDYYMAYQSPEFESSWYWKNYPATEESRKGLLNVKNVTIHTVGLSLGHDNHSADRCWRFPDGWMGGFAQYESIANNFATSRNSSIYEESGTPEFNLWRVANTSGGEYFFAVSSNDLEAIFQKLIKLIKSPTADVNSTIIKNILTMNKHGIRLRSSKRVNITENNCSDNQFGLKLESVSNENVVLDNIFMNNSDTGIYVRNSKLNFIYHNDFIMNTFHSYDNSVGKNTWNASYPVGGNHWDTWTSPDTDQDGFVDIPYNVSGGTNKDHLPFAKQSGWKNEPPTSPDIDVLPDFPKTNDTIICKITKPSVDKDRDNIYYIYQWYLNRGSGYMLQENLTLLTTNLSTQVQSSITQKHDIWRCVVTPTDLLENGTPVEDQVKVQNTPPSQPDLKISPIKLYTNNNITCSIVNTSRDPDNDDIVYIFDWYLDNGSGFKIQSGLKTVTKNLSVAIPSNLSNKHDVWRCLVTPFDGEVNGTNESSEVQVHNTPPIAVITSPKNGTVFDIGDTAYFNGSDSYDSDNDLLTYDWDLDYDGVNFSVDSSGMNISRFWNNYFEGYIALRVTDDDGAGDIVSCYLKVRNIAPQVKLLVEPTEVNISVRMTGEKWHDILIRLYEDSLLINHTLVRYPGNPNKQMFHITNITFNMNKTYKLTINYTPDDDRVNGQENGANPCWVILNFSNGNTDRLHHTFNVQQPMTYNWSVDITVPLITKGLNYTAVIYDNGPDEIKVYWSFGDGTNISTYYQNKNKSYPVNIIETQKHIFTSSGKYTIKLVVTDDHGGKTTIKFLLEIP